MFYFLIEKRQRTGFIVLANVKMDYAIVMKNVSSCWDKSSDLKTKWTNI